MFTGIKENTLLTKHTQIMELIKQSQFDVIRPRLKELGLTDQQIIREISFALQYANQQPKLRECSLESVQKSIINVALTGLTLNPVSKECYLIPRWNKELKANECTLMPGYVGLVKLLTDAGSVKSIVTNIVYSGDEIKINLADNVNPVTHIPELIKAKRGQMIGCYSLATLHNGTRQVEWMDIEDIHAIRGRSESYTYAESKGLKSVWHTDEPEMCRKTVVKRIYKYLPKSDKSEQIEQAINIDNAEYLCSDSQLALIDTLLQRTGLDAGEVVRIESEIGPSMSARRASELIDYLKKNELSDKDAGIPSNNAVREAIRRDN